MAVIYISFSIYLLWPKYFILTILILICYLWYKIKTNLFNISEILNRRISMMNNNNLLTSIQATRIKAKMYKNFNILMHVYFSAQVVIIVVDMYQIYSSNNYGEVDYNLTFMILDIADNVFEVVGLFGACFLFMAKFRGLYFDLPDYENEVDIRETTPMYEAFLPPNENAENLNPGPVVVVQPSTFTENNEDFYHKCMIAIPMRVVRRGSYINDLRQPLIPPGLYN